MIIQSKRRGWQLGLFALLSLLWTSFLVYFVFISLSLDPPKKEEERSFYFKENGKDLKYLLCSYLNHSKRSLIVSSFGLNDKDIISLLESKKIPIHIAYDPKETTLLPTGSHITSTPYTQRGLMHRKFVGIDEELLLVGSTNLTPLALKIHKNLLVAIRSKELYQAIAHNTFLETPSLLFFPLPSSADKALKSLLTAIQSAQKTITLCMYTFTHKELAEALISAAHQGVTVKVYMDRGMAKGTSKHILALLKKHNIPTYTQLARCLLHHKCLLIDDTFIFGSANWTKAAFSKNQEHLFFLKNLSKKERSQIDSFFASLDKSSLKVTK